MATIISSKTSGVGGLSVTGDASGVLQLASADGTAALTINASQNVGIGTSNPATKLTVAVSGAPTTAQATYVGDVQLNRTAITSLQQVGGLEFKASEYGSGYGAKITSLDGGDLVFGNRSNSATWLPRMTIDSSGNVGIGTINPSYKLHVNGGSTAQWFLERSTITTVSPPSSYNGAIDGFLCQVFADTSLFYRYTDLVAGAGSSGSVMRFFTGPSSGSTERMRIDSLGNLLVGTTNTTNIAKLTSYNPGVAATFAVTSSSLLSTPVLQLSKADNNSTASNTFVQFLINGFVSGSGQINANGSSAVAFGSFSDARLKENITELPNQLANILALKPSEFDYKDGSGHQIGFIAQEMKEVYPDVVGEGADGMLIITGWSKTEARLVKSIQELKAIIDTQNARIEALEGVNQ